MIIDPEKVALDLPYARTLLLRTLGKNGKTPRDVADEEADPEMTVKVLIWALIQSRSTTVAAQFAKWCADRASFSGADPHLQMTSYAASENALLAAGRRDDLVFEFVCEAAIDAADSFASPTIERIWQIEYLVELID